MPSSRREFLRLASGITLLAPAALEAASLFRSKPYLQYVSGRRATLLWTSRSQSDAAVEFIDASGTRIPAAIRSVAVPPSTTGEPETVYRFRADVTGLDPGGSYSYRITADGQDVTPANNAFRTDDGNRLKFLAFGDSGTGSGEQAALAKRMNAESVSLVLPLGDLAYPSGTFEQLETTYFGVYSQLMSRTPFFPTPGNHDYYQQEAAPLLDCGVVPTDNVRDEDVGRYYSFDWGPAHFVSIDTNSPLTACANGQDAMLRWLEKDLSRTRKFWRIAYMHHPPYASGQHEAEAEVALVRQHLVPILERYGVQVVLTGHEHSYQRSKPMLANETSDSSSAIVYVVSGGAGASLYPHTVRPHMAASAIAFHYLMGEVEGGTLRMRSVPTAGDDLDSFEIKPKPYLRGPVISAASAAVGAAAGGLASIFGRNLCLAEARTPDPKAKSVQGTSVYVGGRQAQVIYASPDQLNIVLADDITGDSQLEVRTANGSVTVDLTIAASAPAIFTNENGGLLFRSDGSQATSKNPAHPGEELAIYVTGLPAATARVKVSFSEEPAIGIVSQTGITGVSMVRTSMPLLDATQAAVTVIDGSVRSNTVALPLAVASPTEVLR